MTLTNLRSQWAPNITREILAGTVVALALIPEAIAFSLIAGVDPKVGLYASFCIAVITAFAGGRPAMISAATGAMVLLLIVGFGAGMTVLWNLASNRGDALTVALEQREADLDYVLDIIFGEGDLRQFAREFAAVGSNAPLVFLLKRLVPVEVVSSIVARKLNAACASCHARIDARGNRIGGLVSLEADIRKDFLEIGILANPLHGHRWQLVAPSGSTGKAYR